MSIKGTESVESFHKRLGKIMWDKCGMARNATGLQEAITEIRALRDEFCIPPLDDGELVRIADWAISSSMAASRSG